MAWKPRHAGIPGETALSGRHVTLLPLTWPEPAGALGAAMLQEDEELWRYMTIGPFENRAAFDAALRTKVETGGRLLAIAHPEGAMLGFAGFLRLRPEHGSAEIGAVAFGGRLRQSRAGTEAIHLMLGHLFDDLGWRRAEWQCNADNARSARAGRRYGFAYEGRFRQDQWVKGRNRDTLWFSILDHEWPGIKAACEAWLDDRNFDEEGRQRQSLAEIRRASG